MIVSAFPALETPMTPDADRDRIRTKTLCAEADVLDELIAVGGYDENERVRIRDRAIELVERVRKSGRISPLNQVLSEYGLDTAEGVSLMTLAEALLRIPDAASRDALIGDKLKGQDWIRHMSPSGSLAVNAASAALLATTAIHGAGPLAAVARPFTRTGVVTAMRVLAGQFVLGQTITAAMRRARKLEARGYTHSYDMLGEAAVTADDAAAYFNAYTRAITEIAAAAPHGDATANPGISVKLSALHPRYDGLQRDRIIDELVPRVLDLARKAREAGIGFTIDAEEANRLELSLDVIERVFADETLAGWDGFGVVVQAYQRAALPVIDWLHALAARHDRRMCLRLVKGAYWDSEVKAAQVDNLDDFPVFTHKPATDVSYLSCARRLFELSDRFYPQFATHNAATAAAILEIARPGVRYEFQRLHGMGEALHEVLVRDHGVPCRIYAPVGNHRELLAYLVRRLLENGANSSFVNQLADETVSSAEIAFDPFEKLARLSGQRATGVIAPGDIFKPERANSPGWALNYPGEQERYDSARTRYTDKTWSVGPLAAVETGGGETHPVINPANPNDRVGTVTYATQTDVEAAVATARSWDDANAAARAAFLRRVADLYEDNAGEFFAVLTREAGKTPTDAVAELREAIDFLYYYASQVEAGPTAARGLFFCISPWNFPLAIFTGQIAAALAAGNGVLAKPAEATSITAFLAVKLFHAAGVPRACLQLLPGAGAEVGGTLSSHKDIAGVCFTGSLPTATAINRNMAQHLSPDAPLIAETGGINAMIVDSSALIEQAVTDIIASAFQSAGQRCSALRVLYVQEDIATPLLRMLEGAMDELSVGDPWRFASDVGPVIDERARAKITAHVDAARQEGRLIKQLDVPETGTFVGPALISVRGIEDVQEEIFGPVLHVATYRSGEIDAVCRAVAESGYGLTFGMHSRIASRVDHVVAQMPVGNIYVNRNQIGAIVGSQPFGGEGLSGTGPKAGGPHYVQRFSRTETHHYPLSDGPSADWRQVQERIDGLAVARPARQSVAMPGPTGETNALSTYPRGIVLCLGPGVERAREQAQAALGAGCSPLVIAPDASRDEGISGQLDAADLTRLNGFDAVCSQAPEADLSAARQALAARDGAVLPLITADDPAPFLVLERHVCTDTTAAGGNVELLASG